MECSEPRSLPAVVAVVTAAAAVVVLPLLTFALTLDFSHVDIHLIVNLSCCRVELMCAFDECLHSSNAIAAGVGSNRLLTIMSTRCARRAQVLVDCDVHSVNNTGPTTAGSC